MSAGQTVVRLGLPKGRMQAEVLRLMGDAGLPVRADDRGYRPQVGSDPEQVIEGALNIAFEAKFLKPQNIVEMLATGSRDVGFAGADWVRELEADLVELMDTGLDPVKIVAAAPAYLTENGRLKADARPDGIKNARNSLVVASEYQGITKYWMTRNTPDAVFLRSYGATEVFPPEDADIIVDNCATGSTLKANGLVVLDEIMKSSTRLYASKAAMADPAKREAAESIVLLLTSVIEARTRVMVELNVGIERLQAVTDILPCLRSPTISPLDGGQAFAVRIAAPRAMLAHLIPEIKKRGGTDIVVTELSQLVP